MSTLVIVATVTGCSGGDSGEARVVPRQGTIAEVLKVSPGAADPGFTSLAIDSDGNLLAADKVRPARDSAAG